jgi:hypothetical protein
VRSDALQHQHHLQRDRDLRRVAAGRGFPQLGLDVLLRVPGARLFRQMTEQRADVAERDQTHDVRDSEGRWERARPVRARHASSLSGLWKLRCRPSGRSFHSDLHDAVGLDAL